MNHQTIIKAVDNSIEVLCSEFRSHSTFFFTENDIVCYFYRILQQKLPFLKTIDKDGYEHFLIHREYPTPFRCDMGKNKFEIRDDKARTEKGGKYKRGHYDIVVFNPDFIGQTSYEIIKAQNYGLFKDQVLSKIDSYSPIILYGLEFIYRREPLKYSRGDIKEKCIDNFIAKIIQDADKLQASKNMIGFLDHIKMLTFVKGSSKEICYLLKEKLSRRNEIILSFSD